MAEAVFCGASASIAGVTPFAIESGLFFSV
jgi:hypothetical protein